MCKQCNVSGFTVFKFTLKLGYPEEAHCFFLWRRWKNDFRKRMNYWLKEIFVVVKQSFSCEKINFALGKSNFQLLVRNLVNGQNQDTKPLLKNNRNCRVIYEYERYIRMRRRQHSRASYLASQVPQNDLSIRNKGIITKGRGTPDNKTPDQRGLQKSSESSKTVLFVFAVTEKR